jgi:hypothetical protein
MGSTPNISLTYFYNSSSPFFLTENLDANRKQIVARLNKNHDLKIPF